MTKQEQIEKALDVFRYSEIATKTLEMEYKPLSWQGKTECTYFNSLIALYIIQDKYESDYQSILQELLRVFADKANAYNLPIRIDSTFMNSRYRLYHTELEHYREGAKPPSIFFHLFYEKPLSDNPVPSRNFKEVFSFASAFTTMMVNLSNDAGVLL